MERESRIAECEKHEKREANQRAHINKAFEKIEHFIKCIYIQYAKSFNKFHPKNVEINEATIDKVVGFGHFMMKSDAEVAEAIDIYKALGDNIPYGPEDQSTEPL